MRAVKRFTIDRAIWLRGGGTAEDGCFGGSFLLREVDRKRCCIGIYLQACGLSDGDLEGVGSPGYLARNKPHLVPLIPSWLITHNVYERNEYEVNSTATNVLMDVNDDDTMDEDTREQNVISMFKQEGITVDFVGDR